MQFSVEKIGMLFIVIEKIGMLFIVIMDYNMSV